jgi:hypothetical protein
LKETIKKWKNILPIKIIKFKTNMTSNSFQNLINHYSHKIEKLIIPRGGLDNEILFNISSLSNNLFYLDLDCNFDIQSSFFSSLVNLTVLKLGDLEDCDLLCLSTLNKLTHLTLRYSEISENGFSNLSSLGNLVHLRLKDNNDLESYQLSYLKSLSNLTRLDITGESQEIGFSEDKPETQLLLLISPLIHLKQLDLDLNDCIITNNGFSHVSYLINLTHLTIIKCAISDEGFSNLSCLKKLIFLNLGNKCMVSDIGISHLSTLLELKYLFLGKKCTISDVGLTYLSFRAQLSFLENDMYNYTEVPISQLSTLNNLNDESEKFMTCGGISLSFWSGRGL